MYASTLDGNIRLDQNGTFIRELSSVRCCIAIMHEYHDKYLRLVGNFVAVDSCSAIVESPEPLAAVAEPSSSGGGVVIRCNVRYPAVMKACSCDFADARDRDEPYLGLRSHQCLDLGPHAVPLCQSDGRILDIVAKQWLRT